MRRALLALTGVLVTLIASGCGLSVRLDEPEISGPEAETCAALMADLPETVLDQKRRPTDPGRNSAAWGRPPITLRCGVPEPQQMTPTSECLEVNGVGWFDQPGTGGRVFTTLGRDVFVEVAVPSDHAPEAGALTFVADAIDRNVPQHTPCV